MSGLAIFVHQEEVHALRIDAAIGDGILATQNLA
jgi:hypothetical protein